MEKIEISNIEKNILLKENQGFQNVRKFKVDGIEIIHFEKETYSLNRDERALTIINGQKISGILNPETYKYYPEDSCISFKRNPEYYGMRQYCLINLKTKTFSSWFYAESYPKRLRFGWYQSSGGASSGSGSASRRGPTLIKINPMETFEILIGQKSMVIGDGIVFYDINNIKNALYIQEKSMNYVQLDENDGSIMSLVVDVSRTSKYKDYSEINDDYLYKFEIIESEQSIFHVPWLLPGNQTVYTLLLVDKNNLSTKQISLSGFKPNILKSFKNGFIIENAYSEDTEEESLAGYGGKLLFFGKNFATSNAFTKYTSLGEDLFLLEKVDGEKFLFSLVFGRLGYKSNIKKCTKINNMLLIETTEEQDSKFFYCPKTNKLSISFNDYEKFNQWSYVLNRAYNEKSIFILKSFEVFYSLLDATEISKGIYLIRKFYRKKNRYSFFNTKTGEKLEVTSAFDSYEKLSDHIYFVTSRDNLFIVDINAFKLTQIRERVANIFYSRWQSESGLDLVWKMPA